jgi:hypothetical protein
VLIHLARVCRRPFPPRSSRIGLDYVFTRSIAFTTIHARADTIAARIDCERTSVVSRRIQENLLDALLRDLGPALDEINATSLASAEKKLLVRRLIESRLADVSRTHDHENADQLPQKSS